MGLVFNLFFVLLFLSCSSNIKNLLPVKEIKIKSDCKYVVADGIDKISVEVIEETLDKGTASEKKLKDVTLHVKYLSRDRRSYDSIDNSIIIEGTEIKFNTPGDYSITASYQGEKTRKPEIVRARKDLKNVHHISKHDSFDLHFRDEDTKDIISDVEFRGKNGKKLTSENLKNLFETENEIVLDAFLHNSKLGVLIIYLYDVKLENINNVIIKGEKNRLKFNVNIKDNKGHKVEVKDYTLVYKKNKEGKSIQINGSNLLDFEKMLTNKVNGYLESYDIHALVKVKSEEYNIRTNVTTLFVLNKWEEKKNLLVFQPLELRYYRDYYRNIEEHIKVFSKYEDEEEKEIDISEDFIENRIGFSQIIFRFNGKDIGNIKIKYLGNIDINQDNHSIIYKNKDGKILAYLDRNKLESFSHFINGFEGRKLNDDSKIEWRFYIDNDNYETLNELSEIKEFKLNVLKGYKLIFLYSSNLNEEKLESSPITIILFDKPENQKLDEKLIGGSSILIQGLEDYKEYIQYLNMELKQNIEGRRDFKIEHFKSEDFLIYKLENKLYLSPLKGFNFNGEIDIKIGNTSFCRIELEVESKLIGDIEISEWKGLANSITGNYCFANSAFKFLSSFNLADVYYNNGIEEEIELLASYEESEASKKRLMEEKSIIQYAKAIINGIRLNSKGAFNNSYIGELFIYNFLNQPFLNNGPDPLGDGRQHDATEVIDRIFNILRKKELKEDTTIMQKKEIRFYKNDMNERVLVSENLNNIYSSDESLDPREGKDSEQIIKKYLEKATFEKNSEYFLDLQEKNEVILSFKVENKYTKNIRYKNLKELRENIKNINIFANFEKVEIVENELLKIIDEGVEEIQFNKRYKIITLNNLESFLTIENTQSGAVNLYIGKEIIFTQKECHIINPGNLLYIRIKRLIKENRSNVRLDKNILINDELKIQTYTKDLKKDIKKRYKLKAVIMHSGSANGGHYVVYLKNGNKWSYQSDSTVNHNSSLENGVYYGLLYEEIK